MDKYDRWTAITAITIFVLAAFGFAVIGGQGAITSLMAVEGSRTIVLITMALFALVLIFVGAVKVLMNRPPSRH